MITSKDLEYLHARIDVLQAGTAEVIAQLHMGPTAEIANVINRKFKENDMKIRKLLGIEQS